jgi:hypothetical protein
VKVKTKSVLIVSGGSLVSVSWICAAITVTVQVTPVGAWAPLFVAEKSKRRVVVKSGGDVASDVAFDYVVQGVRRGYANYAVERANNLPR